MPGILINLPTSLADKSLIVRASAPDTSCTCKSGFIGSLSCRGRVTSSATCLAASENYVYINFIKSILLYKFHAKKCTFENVKNSTRPFCQLFCQRIVVGIYVTQFDLYNSITIFTIISNPRLIFHILYNTSFCCHF